MARKLKITVKEICETPTPKNENNELYSILKYKYKDRADAIVARFEAYTGRPFMWHAISKLTLLKFRDGIVKDLSPNAAKTNCAWLSNVIHIYCDEHFIQHRALCSTLSVQGERSTFAYILEEDIPNLVEYYRNCRTPIKRAISAFCIVEFYTGARKSDTVELTSGNIEQKTYIDGETSEVKNLDMIQYTSHKTKIHASVPIKPVVSEILSDDSILRTNITTQKIDYHIKNIFEEAGLTRPVQEHRAGKDLGMNGDVYRLCDAVSSHMFRRSFASNLDRNGVRLETISKMMGHTNSSQTRRYICNEDLVLDDDALNFFK